MGRGQIENIYGGKKNKQQRIFESATFGTLSIFHNYDDDVAIHVYEKKQETGEREIELERERKRTYNGYRGLNFLSGFGGSSRVDKLAIKEWI